MIKEEKKILRENYQGPVGTSPFIYVGYTCNNNCIFCFEKENVFYNKETERLKEEIKIIREKFDFINFMGQEPTLRKDLIELIEYAGKLKYKQIGVTTNGRMFFYPLYVRKILETSLNQIVVTVVGCDSKTHDLHTLVKGSFEQTLKGIKNIIKENKKGLSLVINIMVTGLNYKKLLEIVEFYIKLGVQEINIGHVLPFNKDIKNSKKIVAKMSAVVPYLIAAQNRFGFLAKFLFVEYPPCIFPKEYRHLSFPCLEESPQKIRLRLCRNCEYKKKCVGVHRYYVDLYGIEEFKL